ncbi:MAG: carboxypeptidase regulatory-like domain-containing protein [Deltaproteobacteria bacterium]|nr:carboxypeptidase regulatory-like domain-containing protein [Deltaproteobacteria bacterium]
MKKTRIITIMALLAATVLLNQECQSQTPAPAAGAATAAAPAVGGTQSIKVKVAFTGAAPVMGKLKREADPFCGKTPMTDQEVLVNPNGTLKNVVVRVSKGAAPAAVPTTPVVMMNQNNCMYEPRVAAGVVNQKLVIRNSDPVMHNVHTYVGTATGFNQAQMKGSKDLEKTITAGVMKFKCDVHPWMTGYVVGTDNAFFCVTDATGECSIANIPAGTYTLEAWHEKYGSKTADVTVAAGQAAAAAFSYAAQ